MAQNNKKDQRNGTKSANIDQCASPRLCHTTFPNFFYYHFILKYYCFQNLGFDSYYRYFQVVSLLDGLATDQQINFRICGHSNPSLQRRGHRFRNQYCLFRSLFRSYKEKQLIHYPMDFIFYSNSHIQNHYFNLHTD